MWQCLSTLSVPSNGQTEQSHILLICPLSNSWAGPGFAIWLSYQSQCVAVCDTLLQAVGTGCEELLPTVTLGSSEVTYLNRMSDQASWGSGSSLGGLKTLN